VRPCADGCVTPSPPLFGQQIPEHHLRFPELFLKLKFRNPSVATTCDTSYK
jgi:hypothetical protein